MRHLMDITDLSVSEIDGLIGVAEDIIANRQKYAHVCEGKKLATLFLSPARGQGCHLRRRCMNWAGM